MNFFWNFSLFSPSTLQNAMASWQPMTDTSVDSYHLFYVYLAFYIVLTYGNIIDFFQEVCHGDSNAGCSAGCIDISTVCLIKYPHITVSRPDCLLNSIRRIIAPTQPSLRGPCKLVGSSLEAYRNQILALSSAFTAVYGVTIVL